MADFLLYRTYLLLIDCQGSTADKRGRHLDSGETIFDDPCSAARTRAALRVKPSHTRSTERAASRERAHWWSLHCLQHGPRGRPACQPADTIYRRRGRSLRPVRSGAEVRFRPSYWRRVSREAKQIGALVRRPACTQTRTGSDGAKRTALAASVTS